MFYFIAIAFIYCFGAVAAYIVRFFLNAKKRNDILPEQQGTSPLSSKEKWLIFFLVFFSIPSPESGHEKWWGNIYFFFNWRQRSSAQGKEIESYSRFAYLCFIGSAVGFFIALFWFGIRNGFI